MEEQSMTAKETARLIDWMKANGISETKTLECIKYIATGIAPENESTEHQSE